MSDIRLCRDSDHSAMLQIINAAAEAYRGVIPDDCWHEPYMSNGELTRDLAAGIVFWGCEADGALVGVMGTQAVRDCDLIRHAYVLPSHQRGGVGARLIASLRKQSARQMLVGTWAAADWAIRFYQRQGFALVPAGRREMLLGTYWSIPARQSKVSVVLANPSL